MKIIVAPMAGGPTTPALVQAAGEAGAFGFLASGSISAEQLRNQIAAVSVPFGVNFFYPQAEWLPDAPDLDYSFGFAEKLRVALESDNHHLKVLSSSFGCFTPSETAVIQASGRKAWVSVTSPEEARLAEEAGAYALIVQGHEAGGHRLCWSMSQDPPPESITELLGRIHVNVPLIAAGGVRTPADVKKLLDLRGVIAIQCGSAFLLAHEAGTSEFNRALLRRGGITVSTRAFSGRVARGLETAYTKAHPDTPPSYPLLGMQLKDQRTVEETAYCLVGERVELLREASASKIVAYLNGDLD